MLQSTFEILNENVDKVGLNVVVNALQQLCFTKACELANDPKSTKEKSLLFYDTGMALGTAVRIVNRY